MYTYTYIALYIYIDLFIFTCTHTCTSICHIHNYFGEPPCAQGSRTRISHIHTIESRSMHTIESRSIHSESPRRTWICCLPACGMSHSCVCMPSSYQSHSVFMRIQAVHMPVCATPRPYWFVCNHDAIFICVPWRIHLIYVLCSIHWHICAMSYSHMAHVEFLCVPGHIHMCRWRRVSAITVLQREAIEKERERERKRERKKDR